MRGPETQAEDLAVGIAAVGPMDESNRRLMENTRPPGWVNPQPAGRYNMVVLGAGTAGLVTAAGAAGLGGKVALVESNLLGGDCLNFGCVPSKSIIRSARAAFDSRDAVRFGARAPGAVEVDFAAAMQRMRQVRGDISRHDAAERFRKLGVDVFLTRGRFTGPDTLEADGTTLRFARACIATGARAVRPEIEGIVEAGYLTNETVFALTERPRRLAVLGSGPLGCELAQALARLGSEVTIIERSGKFLPREDEDAAGLVARAFQREGIRCLFNTTVSRVTASDGEKQLHCSVGGREQVVSVDEILAGYGRAPNVENLGLEAAGVAYDTQEGVHVDDRLRTTNPQIYAAGDVCLKQKFTHMADATARIVVQNALFFGRKRQSALVVPWCTYTDPEIAHVGLYEREARDRGIEVDTFTEHFGELDRAMADGETEGFVKVHVRRGTDKILGATIVARHAGEMVGEITVAMVGGLGLGTLAGTIHPYPTQAEAIKHVADAYTRTRLTPFVKGMLTRLLAMRR